MLATLRKFPGTFYLAYGMEIFERMAWYGFWIPFPLYLTGSIADGCLGMTDRERGVIAGVATGALADKFSFKGSG
jgi:hypothetical protein